MISLYDLVIVLPEPIEYVRSLFEKCEDDCKEFCCIRKSVLEEIEFWEQYKQC